MNPHMKSDTDTSRMDRMFAVLVLIIFLVFMGLGCSTPKPAPAHLVGNIVGPDGPVIVEDAGNILAKVGHRELIEEIEGEHRHTNIHHHTTKGEPISCTDEGCFAGATTLLGSSTYLFRWPFGRHRGVVRHESAHAVIDTLESRGLIEPTYGDAHPDYIVFKDTNRRVKVQKLVNFRWPDTANVWNEKKNGTWSEWESDCEVDHAEDWKKGPK